MTFRNNLVSTAVAFAAALTIGAPSMAGAQAPAGVGPGPGAQALEATYHGYTVGNWEGDTLVLDSISFVDTTWLGRGGLFHSEKMHIVEKFTRKGDELFYDITIEDPEVFVEPWVMPTRILRPFAGDGIINERAHCEVYENDDITNQLRH